MRFQQVYYVLDGEHRILWIGGEWDEFALANGGSGAVSNKVLSTPLEAHVADAETVQALRQMIDTVLAAHQPLRIDYRCDSPTLARRFLMTIQPMNDGRVLMVHDLRDANTFARPLQPWRYNPEAAARKCSFCCAVCLAGGQERVASAWVAAEALQEPHPEEVRYTLCPECVARVEDAVQSLAANRAAAAEPAAGQFGPGDGAATHPLWAPRGLGDDADDPQES